MHFPDVTGLAMLPWRVQNSVVPIKYSHAAIRLSFNKILTSVIFILRTQARLSRNEKEKFAHAGRGYSDFERDKQHELLVLLVIVI